MSLFVDKNFRTYSLSGFQDLEPERIAPPSSEYADTVKLSHIRNGVLANKEIVNFAEDCIDVVQAKDIALDALVLEPRGQNGITIKGASESVDVSGVLICHGRKSDVCLGQFWNGWRPGVPPTRGVDIRLVAKDGVPPLVEVWDATIPNGTAMRIKVVPKWKWWPYFVFQYCLLRADNLWRRLTRQKPVDTQFYQPGTLVPA